MRRLLSDHGGGAPNGDHPVQTSPIDPVRGHADRSEGQVAASEQIEEISLDRLSFGYSPRIQAEDREHATMLAAAFDELPPILVHAPSMQVIDGVHRVLAARLLGKRHVRVLLFHGTEVEAYIKAVQSNVVHGKPLTRAEREKAALRVLSVHGDWSDRRIASVCGIAPGTVGGLRARAHVDQGPANGRVGRDGKVRPIDPRATRLRVAEALQADPKASIREIALRTGASKRTVSDVRARALRGEDVVPAGLRSVDPQPEPEDGQQSSPVLAEVPAYLSDEDARGFVEWFEARCVGDYGEMVAFVDVIPISRVYEVADAARRCGDLWRRFASELEARANRRRRSRSATS